MKDRPELVHFVAEFTVPLLYSLASRFKQGGPLLAEVDMKIAKERNTGTMIAAKKEKGQKGMVEPSACV